MLSALGQVLLKQSLQPGNTSGLAGKFSWSGPLFTGAHLLQGMVNFHGQPCRIVAQGPEQDFE